MRLCSELRKCLGRGGRHCAALGLLAIVASGSGCGKSGVEGELERFRSTGHTVAQFADTDPAVFGAKKCQAGVVDQLNVLLCEYGNSDDAGKSQPSAERWGGEIGTVVVLRRGPVLFAVADRNKVDPSGKAISALAKVFRRVKGR
jgi:hypothetical protein